MEKVFWDIAGPVLIVLFLLLSYWSFRLFKEKRYIPLLVTGIINIGISAVFAWSIGPIIFAIGVIQFYIGAMNSIRKKSSHK